MRETVRTDRTATGWREGEDARGWGNFVVRSGVCVLGWVRNVDFACSFEFVGPSPIGLSREIASRRTVEMLLLFVSLPAAQLPLIPVTSAESIRWLLSSSSGSAPLRFYVPPGTQLALGGSALSISSEVEIFSDGAGATFDAQGISRHFDVKAGAQLQLQHLTLMNGQSTNVSVAWSTHELSLPPPLLVCASACSS